VRRTGCLIAVLAWSCGQGAPLPGIELPASNAPTPPVSSVSRVELREAEKRLPPVLREKAVTPAGERSLERALEDRALLFQEARRRHINDTPAIQEQLHDLELRLSVQKLLEDEEQRQGTASDADARAYFESHRAEFGEPDRIHLGRILVSVLPGASDSDRKKARTRADSYLARLHRGEVFGTVALEGDGPERARKGDAGWVTRPELSDSALAQAAFGLAKIGSTSGVVSTRDGLVIVSLIEHRAAHQPSFEEERSRVLNRLDPVRKRAAYDALLARLRRGDSEAGADRVADR
jgi:parvulin-like peptidyl-prolyl isomerase